MNTEKIGKFIALKRKGKGLTQKELAEKIGVTDRAVSKWERGMGCPDVSLLDELSKELEISIVELLKGEEIKQPEILEKDIIDSMKYSKIATQEKNKTIINSILVTLMIVIIIFVIVCNIINCYNLNKTINISYSITDEMRQLPSDIEKYSNIILNNQGKYTDEEYSKIVKYVNKINNTLDDKAKEYLLKEKYTVKDFYEFKQYYKDNLYENFIYENYIQNKSIYYIILKYDIEKVYNFIGYYESKNTKVRSFVTFTNKVVDSTYKYDGKVTEVSALYITVIMNAIYKNEVTLLEDIIEVGELNE